jgi:hypothetical protein
MKRFLLTIAISCFLSGAAYAGEVPSVGLTATGYGEEPPASSDTWEPGDIPSGGVMAGLSDSAYEQIQVMIFLVF